MKTINHIAHHILEHRRRPSMFLHVADLQEDIGQSGLEAARQRGWVQPDMESGQMIVTPDMTTISEMTSLANDRDERELQIGDPTTVVDDGQTYTGVVQRVGDDGKVELSFEGGRGPRRTDPWNRDEVHYAGDEDGEEDRDTQYPAMQAR